MGERLVYLARRVEEDRFFLASALAEYARGNDLDNAGLARLLGCPAVMLARLRLCRRPDGSAPTFRADVARIAAHCGVDGASLAQIVRWADAVGELRAASAADAARDARGTLLAARDRAGDDEPPLDEHGGRS